MDYAAEAALVRAVHHEGGDWGRAFGTLPEHLRRVTRGVVIDRVDPKVALPRI